MRDKNKSKAQLIEEELRQSEERYRTLVEMEKDVIFSVDVRGYITSLNSASRQWGYEPEELVGRHFLEIIPSEWQEKTAVELQNRLLQDGEITAETVVLDKDGKRRPMEYSAIVMRQDGEYAGAQGICRDISERKAMEQTLRKNAADLEMILNSVPAFIYYKDVEGRIVRGNFTALTGIPEEKWKGKTVFELLPNLAETYHTDDMEVISTGKARRNIIEPLETPKGIRWLQSHKLPTKDEGGECLRHHRVLGGYHRARGG